MTALPAFVESTIAAQVHGRFLVRPQQSSSSVISPEELRTLSSVLICRGTEDQWNATDTFAADVQRLGAANVSVHAHVLAGGHEWSREVLDAAGRFLREQVVML